MDENNVIFQNIQFIYLQYPILSTIFLIHLLFRLIDPRPNRLKEVDIGAITKKSKIIRFKPTQGRHTIVVTGGCGFVGYNLIKYFLEKTNFKIISLDDYSSGSKKNHIKNRRVNYISGHTKDINKILREKK